MSLRVPQCYETPQALATLTSHPQVVLYSFVKVQRVPHRDAKLPAYFASWVPKVREVAALE